MRNAFQKKNGSAAAPPRWTLSGTRPRLNVSSLLVTAPPLSRQAAWSGGVQRQRPVPPPAQGPGRALRRQRPQRPQRLAAAAGGGYGSGHGGSGHGRGCASASPPAAPHPFPRRSAATSAPPAGTLTALQAALVCIDVAVGLAAGRTFFCFFVFVPSFVLARPASGVGRAACQHASAALHTRSGPARAPCVVFSLPSPHRCPPSPAPSTPLPPPVRFLGVVFVWREAGVRRAVVGGQGGKTGWC